jgi:4-hydroxybenzoyl-CoA reductase beta subunit
MSLPPFELQRPSTLAEACALLADTSQASDVLAGGTQMLTALRNQTRHPRRLVDISAIPGLARLAFSESAGLTIGARVTLRRLSLDRDVLRLYPALAEAACAVGTPQLQAMGTVAGNLCQDTCCLYVDRVAEQRDALAPCHKLQGDRCHVVSTSPLCWANYAGDLAPVLIVLGATCSVIGPSGGDRRAVTALFTGDGAQPIALSSEIVVEVNVPPPSRRSGTAYLKLRQRASLDYPLLGVAASVTLAPDDTCLSARVALTGVERRPLVVPEAEALAGAALTPARVRSVAEAAYRLARPVKNAWGYGASYRVRMTRPYVTRAIASAAARAQESETARD